MFEPIIRTDPLSRTLRVDVVGHVVRAIITTNQPDRTGAVLLPDGIRNRDAFLLAPVVLWDHFEAFPIGVCSALEVTHDGIIAETTFFKTRFARDVFGLFVEGVFRRWALAFTPHAARPIPASIALPKGGTFYPSWELLEYSVVPSVDHPHALTFAVTSGHVRDANLRGLLLSECLGGLAL